MREVGPSSLIVVRTEFVFTPLVAWQLRVPGFL